MITSAQEFKRLRESEDVAEYSRAAQEEVPLEVWEEIVAQMPEMHFWVAHNKTVPVVILEKLARSEEWRVRVMVAEKRRITEAIALLLATDPDECVRSTLARNPKLPAAALALLRQDSTPLIQEALAARDARVA
ncbi:MAG: HEAT repeat domain-containing protein [Prosthecobacter sp.]